MKDPSLSIRTALVSLIKATLAGASISGVGVFDNVLLAESVSPRVVIDGQTYDEDFTKDKFGGNATVDINVSEEFAIGVGGSKKIDQIIDVISQALVPQKGQTGLSLSPDFRVVTIRLQIIPFGQVSQPIAKTYILRKILRVSIFLEQI